MEMQKTKTRSAVFLFPRCCAPVGAEGRAVACDISRRCTVTSRPSLLVFGHQQSLGQSGSCLASCQECLRGLEDRARFLLVLGGALVAAIGSSQCPSQSRALCFPSPAWFGQLGTTGCACSSGGELCGAAVGWAMGLGEPGGCPSRGAWAFLPPLPCRPVPSPSWDSE